MDSAIAAHELLQYLRFGYPPVLLVVLLAVFLVHSSQVANNASRNTEVQYGPGGKPLPNRTRMMMAVARDLPAELAWNSSKGLFVWLGLFVLATYIAEAAIHMTHAMISKSEQWWCGQAVVVGLLFQKLKPKLTKQIRSLSLGLSLLTPSSSSLYSIRILHHPSRNSSHGCRPFLSR